MFNSSGLAASRLGFNWQNAETWPTYLRSFVNYLWGRIYDELRDGGF